MIFRIKALLILSLSIWVFEGPIKAQDSLQAKLQNYAEKGVKETKEFIDIVNAQVTNYGTPADKLMYKRIIVRYMHARTNYLAFHFGTSFNDVKRAQRLLIVLLDRQVDAYRRDTRLKWMNITGKVLNQGRYKLQSSISQGLRDLENTRIQLTLARNIQPHLLSNKVKYYLEALEYTNNSVRRYIHILLKMEAVYPLKETGDFNKQEENIFSGFPKKYNEVRRLHYNSHFKPFDLPSELEKVWEQSNDFSFLKESNEEWEDIEDPPVREGGS